MFTLKNKPNSLFPSLIIYIRWYKDSGGKSNLTYNNKDDTKLYSAMD